MPQEHLFAPDSPWEPCYQDFLRQLSRSHSHATQVAYAGVLRRFFCDGKSPEQYTRQDVEDFIYAPSDKTWTRSADGSVTPATTNFRLSVLSSFYKYAATYQVGYDTHTLLQHPSPTTGVHRKQPERTHRALTDDELRAFFGSIPDTVIGLRDRALFCFYFFAARRRSEIQRLRWKDIQPSSTVSSGWQFHFRGKGKSYLDDSIELPTPVVEALMRYLEASGRLDTINPDDPVFVAVGREPGQGGNVKPGEVRALTEAGIVRRLEHYARLAGIEHISLHMFRHASARARYAEGSSLRDIQHLLRHQSIATTDLYIRTLVGTEDPGAKLLTAKWADLSKPRSPQE
jgi:integrase